jgi:hypothetical protein
MSEEKKLSLDMRDKLWLIFTKERLKGKSARKIRRENGLTLEQYNYIMRING